MATILSLVLWLAAPGQLPTDHLPLSPPFSEDAGVRLAYMKESVAPYRIHRTAAGSPRLRLIADPIFRLDNPVTSVKDSAIFLWTDPETGRPEAAIQMFRAPTKFWIHDWTSLATSPIVAEVGPTVLWRPKPGVQFHPLPEAPAPQQPPRHGSASFGRWPTSSRPPTISWARAGPSSGSCRSRGFAMAKPTRRSRMVRCSRSYSARTPRWSS